MMSLNFFPVLLLFLGGLVATSGGSRGRQLHYDKRRLQDAENSSERQHTINIYADSELQQMIKLLNGKDEAAQRFIRDTYKQPRSRDDALGMCLVEIVLNQRFAEEKIKLLRDLYENPVKHKELIQRLTRLGYKNWKVYMDSKLDFYWRNLLLRWFAYAKAHPENPKVYDALFKMIRDMTMILWSKCRVGLEEFTKGVPAFSEADHYLLYQARSKLIDNSLFKNTWFQDSMTNSAFFYSKLLFLMVEGDGIRAGVEERLFAQKHQEMSIAKEYDALNDRLYGRVTHAFFRQWHEDEALLTPKNIDGVCNAIFSTDELLVASDIAENENGSFFEKSFFFKDLKPCPTPKPRKPTSNIRPQRIASNTPPEKKVDVKNVQSPNSISPSTLSSQPSAETSESSSVVAVSPVVKPSTITKACPIPIPATTKQELISGSGQQQFSDSLSSFSPHQSASVGSFPLPNTTKEEEEPIFSMDDFLAEGKRLATQKKIIRQQEKERSAGMRLKNLASNSFAATVKAGAGKTPKKQPAVKAMSTADYCTAFPKAHELFIRNDGIIQFSKAKRFAWVFDEQVIIKEKHMRFLCKLFGLSAEGEVNFDMLRKTFYVIEGPVQNQRNNFFQFSHVFVITGEDVNPTGKEFQEEEAFVSKGKGIHREHDSSDFNWTRAVDLFEGAAMDPRLWIAIQ